jgi:tetratricopeptide (TPR) repeat protein
MMKDIRTYNEIIEKIYLGLYEDASVDIRNLREQNTLEWNAEWSLMQNLLAARVALKSGLIPENIATLETSLNTSAFLSGEINMLKGIVNYQSGNLKEGREYFAQAQKFFQNSTHKSKELLCWYNLLIGDTHLMKKSLHEFLIEFRKLELEAESIAQYRILGLVYRQKSYLYKENNKINAAFHEAEKSIKYLELYCAASDFHLGLLNITEILIELGQSESAKSYYEMILEPLDRRVQFPKAYVESRLFKNPISEENQDQSCPHFLGRHSLWLSRQNESQQLDLSVVTGHNSSKVEELVVVSSDHEKLYVQLNNTRLALKRYCLESKLIEILKSGPQSKLLICEKLWPEYSDTHHLDNRLHRLVSRINKKIEGLVLYSAKTYKLCGTHDAGDVLRGLTS